MKGAKGGNRDRIISWLFSEKNRKKREEELEIEKAEEIKLDEKHKERRKSKKTNEEVSLEQVEDTNISIKPDLTTPTLVEESEIKDNHQDKGKSKDGKPKTTEEKEEEFEYTLIDIFGPDTKVTDKGKQKPVITDTSVEVDEIKDKVSDDKKPDGKEEVVPGKKEETYEVPQNEIIELEKPELIKISIIEEIENILKNDQYDLKDIAYRIEVLQQQEKDEVLLENIEKIQKELDDLIRRFNQIKDRYSDLYGYISVKDMEFITGLGIGNAIKDYIGNGKEGLDTSKTLDQINEIKEFVEIINSVIEIEKKKDDVQGKVDEKLEIFGIRDEDFVKLQDQYANVELINAKVEKYNMEITSALVDIEAKIANSVDITRRIETTTSLIPDFNRIMEATILLASTKFLPPTPVGTLFKASLFVSAAHMMATALTPRTEQREVTTTTVTDYSTDIKIGKDNINSILDNIDSAFSEINYMKDVFEKEFREYACQIPEYDKLIQNIFNIERELSRQQVIAYNYSHDFDKALDKNNQKVKRYEND